MAASRRCWCRPTDAGMALDRFPPNPDYGAGVFRRRMTLAGRVGEVAGELFDDFHHMRCGLAHDGEAVTAIAGEVLRFPFSTCAGADIALQELVGMRLDAGADLHREGRAQRNCTHLFDLAALAIDFAPAQGARVIEIEIADARAGGPVTARAWLDDTLIHDWHIADETICVPFGGRSLFGGFAPWARTQFAGEALQAALQIQKSALVARGRRYIVDRGGGDLTDEPERVGSCFSFSEANFPVARRLIGYARNLRDGFPGDLR